MHSNSKSNIKKQSDLQFKIDGGIQFLNWAQTEGQCWAWPVTLFSFLFRLTFSSSLRFIFVDKGKFYPK